MTNQEAIRRIQQKCDYMRTKLIGATERQAFYAQLDIDAFELAISCIQYAQDMADYEASSNQFSS